MRGMIATRAGLAVLLVLAGCGLVSGLDQLAVGDAGASDGSDAVEGGVAADAGLDVGSCGAGACGAPDGFQPALLAMSRDTTCAGATDVLVDPTAPSSACTCSCVPNVTNCVPQPLLYASGTGCTTKGSLPVTLDGGCNGYNGDFPPTHMSVGPFALASDAGCASTLVVVDGKVSATAGRVCPVSSCTACDVPAGFQLCYVGPSSAKCPTGTTAHAIALTAEIACSPCTACTSTATCGGTLTIFDDKLCKFKTDSVPVDGSCVTLNGDSLGSFQYSPVPIVGSCTAGTSTTSATLTGEATACCP